MDDWYVGENALAEGARGRGGGDVDMFCKFVVVKLPAWEALIDDPLSKNSVRVADVKNTSVSTV